MGQDSAILNRVLLNEKGHSWFNAIGNYWCFLFVVQHRTSDWGGVWREGSFISHPGNMAVWMPAHSLVQWKSNPGIHAIGAFVSRETVSKRMPTEPIAFPTDLDKAPTSVSAIVDLVLKNQFLWHPISREYRQTSTARRTKHILDRSINIPLSITDISKELRVHHSALTRAFSQTFGISPSEYRMTVRNYNALTEVLLSDVPILDVLLGTGFNNSGLFNRQFRREFGFTPTYLRNQKKLRPERESLEPE